MRIRYATVIFLVACGSARDSDRRPELGGADGPPVEGSTDDGGNPGVPLLFESHLGIYDQEERWLRAGRMAYLFIDADWRYWVYSPEALAETEGRGFRLSGLSAWAPVRTGIVAPNQREDVLSSLRFDEWERWSTEEQGMPVDDQGTFSLSSRSVVVTCGGGCSSDVSPALVAALELSRMLYQEGTEEDGPVAVSVLPVEMDTAPDVVDFEQAPPGLEPATLVAPSQEGAGVEIDDVEIGAWLRAQRRILFSTMPKRPFQYIGVESDDIAYKLYFRDLAPGELADTGAFDLFRDPDR